MLDDPTFRQAQEAGAAEAARPRRRFRLGLAGRVVILISAFVMIAEVAVYVPSIANFRNNWLKDRVSSAYTAALVFQAAPREVPETLASAVLGSVGAKTIVLKYADTRRLLAASDMPPRIDEMYDLRTASPWDAIIASYRALTAQPGRMLRVVADAPMGGEFMEITLDETPLREAMFAFSARILGVSLIISLFVATLAALAIHQMVLRPVRRLTSSIIGFGADPEDASRMIQPSGSNHEIGIAEDALAVMQNALLRELNQKKHLAALGLAVAKINHDLRNMLSSAQLLSDRLGDLSDPLAKRVAPKLVGTLDRAIAFCQSTLAYGRAVERQPKPVSMSLRMVVTDAGETVLPGPGSAVQIVNRVPRDLEISADSEQMFRVFLNLLRNAVEALENAGPQPGRDPVVSIDARMDRDFVIIDVADSGPGVPESVKAHLFEAFHGSGRPGGTGLGLSIAADLVRAHGGSIELVPDIEAGATFRVMLPRRDR
jgi:signal transduction histidine kinase